MCHYFLLHFRDFKRCTERVGLKIHPDKKKLSNQRSNRQTEATIDNIKVEIVQISEQAKYLGQTMTLEEQETREMESRIRAAWASFSRYNKNWRRNLTFLRHRLHSKNMVITPTLTYGAGTWTLSQEHENMIRSTPPKMLRLIV